MNLELQKIVNKSLELENDFSSSSHASNTIMYESQEAASEEFIIPSRYHKNTLVLLPINQEHYYVYWELTQELLHEYKVDLNQQKLYLKVEDSSDVLLFEFESSFDLSEYFFSLKVQNRDISVKLGYMKENKFIVILQSNNIRTFSSTIKLPDISNEIWLEKHKNYIKIIQSNIENMVFNESSASYMKQLKRLHYLNNAIITKSSSTTLLGRKND
ncbi:MAG: DUF4912 domain-containing protein [Arcobacteraceae bacterium]